MKNQKPRFQTFEIVFLAIMLIATIMTGCLLTVLYPDALGSLSDLCGMTCAG